MPRSLKGYQADKKRLADARKKKEATQKLASAARKASPTINPYHLADRWEKNKNRGMDRERFLYHYNKNFNKAATSKTLSAAIAKIKEENRVKAAKAKRVGGTRALGTSKSRTVSTGLYKGNAHGAASTKGRAKGSVSA